MPASQPGFGGFLVDRALAPSPAGFHHVPVLGCPPLPPLPPPPGTGTQTQQLAAMAAMAAAGFPLFPGLQGFGYVPYAHSRPVTHMASPYDLKPSSAYHPALLARASASPYYPHPSYRPGTAEDQRVPKVATRESTGALKAWLNEHLKNPYPTKGEKIMLAIVTKMSLTQVSTWFANARRRLKKENRVSWANAKGKSDDDEEEEEENEEEGESDAEDALQERCKSDEAAADGQEDSVLEPERVKPEENKTQESGPDKEDKEDNVSHKPKIWSLAETATSATSDSARKPAADSSAAHMGTLWAEWASRNGLFVPAVYPSEVL